MRSEHFFAGVAVADGERAWPWYERLFGRSADMSPHQGERVWRLSEGASVYVVEDRDRAGGGLITLALAELERELASLARRAIAFERHDGGATRPATAVVIDPDGNRITLFEAPR